MCNSRLGLTECRLSIRFSAPNYLAYRAGILAILQRATTEIVPPVALPSPGRHPFFFIESIETPKSRYECQVRPDSRPESETLREGGKEGSGERKGALQKTRKSDSEIAIKFRKWDPVRFAFQSRFGRWQTILPLGGHRVSKLTLPPFRLRFPSGQTRVRTLPLVGPVGL